MVQATPTITFFANPLFARAEGKADHTQPTSEARAARRRLVPARTCCMYRSLSPAAGGGWQQKQNNDRSGVAVLAKTTAETRGQPKICRSDPDSKEYHHESAAATTTAAAAAATGRHNYDSLRTPVGTRRRHPPSWRRLSYALFTG